MPSFPKPSFNFSYAVDDEVNNLRNYRNTAAGRKIPKKNQNRILLATWNIANLGQQERRSHDYQLIAEIISWFDLVAIQECKDALGGLREIQEHLPGWSAQFSDRGGNDERMVFLYDPIKVSLLEKTGEIAVSPREIKWIKLPGIIATFEGFDRNPFISSFVSGNFEFLLVNAHSFFGSAAKEDVSRRALETYAIARWADLRARDKDAYVSDIIVLGDLNMPKAEPGDPIYSVLRKRGLEKPEHSTRIGSTIASDKEYDQLMFFPNKSKQEFTGKAGVFDFDGAIFPQLWSSRTQKQFNAYLRYYISDHRPLWAQFST